MISPDSDVPAGDQPPLVRFTRVQKRYSRRFQLHVDDLVLPRHDCVMVVGANGSGKSTLLRVLAGASRGNTGQLWRHPDWARLRIAYVPQAGGLYGELNVADNLAIRRSYYRYRLGAAALPGRRRGRTAEPYAQRLGIESILRTPVHALSGGMHRLVSLAAALQADPDVLIIDEPFGDLDDRGVEAVRAVLCEVVPTLLLFVTAMPIDGPSLPARRRLEMIQGRLSSPPLASGILS